MADETRVICGQLVAAVEVMMNPVVEQARRLEAFNRTEEFKQSNPLAVACGFRLSERSHSPVVRHFGLKIIEDAIKLRWNDMSPEQKLDLKNGSMELVASSGLSEPTHIKHAVAKLVVEIIKREWPQHWPTLWAELDGLCQQGDVQTEMVMLVLLRLVEDVAVLQTLEQSQRRKEIYHALSANMESIFQFMLQLLEKHYQVYLAAQNTPGSGEPNCKVCRAVLNTFTALVEWVAMSFIMANERYLIKVLCHLLAEERLQLPAAECLLSIVSWKAGKLNDRMQLLALFHTEMMAPLFQAMEAANAQALEADHYNVFKKMVQIFVELGSQLCALWSQEGTHWLKEVPQGRPENFQIYLNALLACSSHPSQVVNHYANELWAKFFRHADIGRDSVFRTYIPKWTTLALKKYVKVGQPSRSDHPSCAYAQLDFDSDEDFASFFGRYRIILVEGIKLVSRESADLPLALASEWFTRLLASPPNFGPGATMCTVDSPCYLEGDAIASVLEAILVKLSPSALQPLLPTGGALVKLCLDYSSPDPMFTSVLLSGLSALFPMVAAMADQFLLPVITQIFQCITYSGGKPLGEQSSQTKFLRRHGCALMVKVANRYPKALVPLFAHLRDEIIKMRGQNLLGFSEFTTLVEGLVLISNEFADYQTQAEFLKAISQPVCEMFHQIRPHIHQPEAFIAFVGLSAQASTSGSESHYANTSQLKFCLTFVLSVCRRAIYPSDLNACRSGGFVLSESNGKVALRNPAWEVANSVLVIILELVSTMNGLWKAENTGKFHPDYAKALGILESEKNTICGVGSKRNGQPKTPLSRMQIFLFEIFENNFHFLSQLCSSCGYEFYQLKDLADNIIGRVFQGVDEIPDYRLRAVIRMFVKCFINKCPSSAYAPVLAPILQSVCPFMLERLSQRWKYLVAVRESPNFDEDNTDSQEVVDDVVCRHLTREYLDVVKAILTNGGGSDIPLSAFQDLPRASSSDGIADGDQPSGGAGAKSLNVLSLSELGSLALQHGALGNCLMGTLLKAVLWPDSPTSVRACSLIELALPQVIKSGQLGQEDAKQVMFSILSAIHVLGQHESNYIALIQLAIQAFEWMRLTHPVIVEVLAQVPGCNQDDLRRFDEKMMSILTAGKENMVKGGDRTKKDMFKKLINQFIGKDVAELFKHDVVIKNLPTLQPLKTKQKTPSMDETEKSDMGLGKFFAQSDQPTS
eukprot:snap_masked-scaffold1460_size40381-processed-gene-0.0 protein:Tk04335 transcript:snap_masked-scaffold1460_size40381-processed-gene-0.0-mRNA-1 annotation:"PREDICTED: exportin-5"